MRTDDEDLDLGRLEGVRGPWPGVDSEAVLDALLDATAVAVLGQDLGGRITLWNAGAEEMYGWAPAEVVGSSIERISRSSGSSSAPVYLFLTFSFCVYALMLSM